MRAAITNVSLLAIALLATALIWTIPRSETTVPRVSEADASLVLFEPAKYDLGDMQLGERREARIVVQNASPQTLNFESPEKSCGCIKAQLSPATLEPNESGELVMMVGAPLTPQEIHKQVELRCREYPDSRWQIEITGHAVATIWAEPHDVKLVGERDAQATGRVAVRYAQDVQLGDIESSDPALQLSLLRRGDGCQAVDLRVQVDQAPNSPPGQATLRVFDKEHSQCLLEIPVQWSARANLVCMPQLLRVKKDQGWIERTLIVLVNPHASSQPPRVEPLQSWVSASQPKKQNSGFQLQVRIDSDAMPTGTDLPAVRVHLGEGETASTVLVRNN